MSRKEELASALKLFRLGGEEEAATFTTVGRDALEYLARRLAQATKKPITKFEVFEHTLPGE